MQAERGLKLLCYEKWFRMRPKAASALKTIMATEESRYVMDMADVSEGDIAVTNGRQLLVVHVDHEIMHGHYHITNEGWMVGPFHEGRFPKWQPLILKPKQSALVWDGDLAEGVPELIWTVNRQADTALSIDLLQLAVRSLLSLGADRVKVYRSRKQKKDAMIQIKGKLTESESFTCLQMPVGIRRTGA